MRCCCVIIVLKELFVRSIFLFSPERPDCTEGRLCFVFYSSLKNLKEVYICPAQGQKGPVRGQVRHTSYSTDKEVPWLEIIISAVFPVCTSYVYYVKELILRSTASKCVIELSENHRTYKKQVKHIHTHTNTYKHCMDVSTFVVTHCNVYQFTVAAR